MTSANWRALILAGAAQKALANRTDRLTRNPVKAWKMFFVLAQLLLQ